MGVCVFSGQDTSFGQVCLCVCLWVKTITFISYEVIFDVGIWQVHHEPIWSNWNAKVIGHSSLKKDENSYFLALGAYYKATEADRG